MFPYLYDMKLTSLQKNYIKESILNRMEFDRTHPCPIHRLNNAFVDNDKVRRIEWSQITVQFDCYEIPFKTYLEKQRQYHLIKITEFDADIREKKLRDLLDN